MSFESGAVAQTNFEAANRDLGQKFFSATSSSYAPDASVFSQAITSANIATGQLRARQDAVAVNAEGGVQTFGTAFIADSFRHLTGLNPYQWTSSTQAKFNIHIDGNQSLLNTSGNVNTLNFSKLWLIIYQRGTLDSAIPFCSATVIQSFFWSIGPGDFGASPCGGSYISNLAGNLNQDLSAVFTPGGDFDWAFGITVGGAFHFDQDRNSNLTGQWHQDFGNTAKLHCVGPADSTVQSRSGVFPGAVVTTVPEPGTMGLMALALACLGWRRPSFRVLAPAHPQASEQMEQAAG